MGKADLKINFINLFSSRSFFNLMKKAKQHKEEFDVGILVSSPGRRTSQLTECTLKSSLWSFQGWSVMTGSSVSKEFRALHERD
jgi:UDP-N-acetylglucosamine pyrophosphorylase